MKHQHIEPKAYMGVDTLLGLTDRLYEILLCEACSKGEHRHCSGKKSKLLVGQVEVLGPCQCGHGLLPKGDSNEPNSGS